MKKYILILMMLIGFGATAQTYTINGQAIRFANRIGIPTKDTLASLWSSPADTSAITIRPQDSIFYYRYKGRWRSVGSGGGGGSVDSNFYATLARLYKVVDSFNLVIPTRISDTLNNARRIKAAGSDGVEFKANSGAKAFSYGQGGGSQVVFYGLPQYDINRNGSLSSLSLTPKGYVDSIAALLLRRSDTLTFVRTFGNQSIAGRKSFTDSIVGVNQRLTGNLFANIGDFKASVVAGGAANFGSANALNTSFIHDDKFQHIRLSVESDLAIIRTDWFSGAGGAQRDLSIQYSTAERMRLTSTGVTHSGVATFNNSIVSTAQGNNLAVTVDSAVTGTTYTLALTDAGRLKRVQNSGGNCVITVPQNSSVAFPIGTQIKFMLDDVTNELSFVGETNVTIVSLNNILTLKGRGATAVLTKVNTNRHILEINSN